MAHIHQQHMPQFGIDGPQGPSFPRAPAQNISLALLSINAATGTIWAWQNIPVCECKPKGGRRQCFCLQVYLSGADNTHTHAHLNFYTSKHNDSLHIIHDPGLLNCNRLERACRFGVRGRKAGVTSCTVKERKKWRGISKRRSSDTIGSSSSCEVTQSERRRTVAVRVWGRWREKTRDS